LALRAASERLTAVEIFTLDGPVDRRIPKALFFIAYTQDGEIRN
jgi:hypothetical protein